MNTRLENLRAWATRRHGDQLYGDLPYCFHLMETEMVAIEFFPGDEQLREGCWGHDLKEDRQVNSVELLEAGFHPEVVLDIEAVTDEPGATRHERKRKTLPKTRARGISAVKLKLCDRVANVRHGLRTGHYKFDRYRREQKFFERQLFDETHVELLPLWQHLRELLR